MAVEKFGPHAMGIELGDQVDRLVLRHAFDTSALAGRNVKRFAACIGVGADNRMGDVGGFRELLRGELGTRAISDPPAGGIAGDRPQPVHTLLHPYRPRPVSGARGWKDPGPPPPRPVLSHPPCIKSPAAA